jgi:class 3 adenylate cyclase
MVLMSETTRDALPAGLDVVEFERMLLKGANDKQAIYQLRTDSSQP